MGFYLRKSVAVGPFRFNLSGSGVGMSVGVRGLRVGGVREDFTVVLRRSCASHVRSFAPRSGDIYVAHSVSCGEAIPVVSSRGAAASRTLLRRRIRNVAAPRLGVAR
jgi:hypothetical protein